jgi:prepilin signal peptidase PulO-like enzyme (type II secretory pathway)
MTPIKQKKGLSLSLPSFPTIPLLALVGYGLLLLSLLDVITIVYPPRLTDPTWELQVIASLVERVPVPLLGFALVFSTQNAPTTKLGKSILGSLSWLTLLIGIFFLLLIPLGVSDVLRIRNQTNAQLEAQSMQQIARFDQIEQQLNQASEDNLRGLATRLGQRNPAAAAQSPQELKTQLLGELNQAKKTVRNQAQATRSARQNTLFKSLLKWSISALISGTLFICMWRTTAWARRTRKWGLPA